MLNDFHRARIYLHLGRIDFRKSINGLAMIVETGMKEKPLSGNLYVFCHRRRDRIKILYWDRNGFCLWYKRLEEEKFRWPKDEREAMEITREELSWLLAGLDITSSHRRLEYAGMS